MPEILLYSLSFSDRWSRGTKTLGTRLVTRLERTRPFKPETRIFESRFVLSSSVVRMVAVDWKREDSEEEIEKDQVCTGS